MMHHKIILTILTVISLAKALDPLVLEVLAHAKKIIPSKIKENIPSRLSEKIKEYDLSHNDIYESYTFPTEYKKTIYKDQEQKTTLVNVFPKQETITPTVEFQSLEFQTLETSTTLIYEMLNSTVEYQTTPMLNSTLKYPNTVPVQTVGYVTPEFQHEVHVFPTKINITEVTSTVVANYTKVEEVDNAIPFA